MGIYPLKTQCDPYPIQLSRRLWIMINKDGTYHYEFHNNRK